MSRCHYLRRFLALRRFDMMVTLFASERKAIKIRLLLCEPVATFTPVVALQRTDMMLAPEL